MPTIRKTFSNDIRFDDEISKEGIDGVFSVAINNLPFGMSDESCSSNGYIIVSADSEEELEEKTINIIYFIELYTKNRILKPVINKNDKFYNSVLGFNIYELTQGFNERRSYIYKPSESDKKYTINDHITKDIPKQYFVFEDEETGEDLVLFYNLYSEVVDEKQSQEDIDIDLENNPLNQNVELLDLKDDEDNKIVAYGDAVILNMSTAQEYYTFD